MESRFSNSTEETEREGKCELIILQLQGEGAVRDGGEGYVYRHTDGHSVGKFPLSGGS